MSSMLDNELVRKYFCFFGEGVTMAERVLAAMQEPLRNGDKCLLIHPVGDVVEIVSDRDYPETKFHGDNLRLPDKFQVAGKMQGHCETCSCRPYQPPPAADPVEEKVREIMYSVTEHGNVALESQLRELVAILRKSHV